MAKEYKYKNILLSKKEFIGLVSVNDKMILKIKNARNWIHYLKENNYKLEVFPKPSCNELSPKKQLVLSTPQTLQLSGSSAALLHSI